MAGMKQNIRTARFAIKCLHGELTRTLHASNIPNACVCSGSNLRQDSLTDPLQCIAGPRLRGKSLQERAYASAADTQARSGGQPSTSPSGSDAHGAQASSPALPAPNGASADGGRPVDPPRLKSPETEAASGPRRPLAGVPCPQAPQQQPPQRHQGRPQPPSEARCQQQQAGHESHQHPPQPRSHQYHQQKAILPGVLASLMQAERSFHVHPGKAARPPLAPTAPGRRSGSDLGHAHVDGRREGVATSQQHPQQPQHASQHRSATQPQQQHPSRHHPRVGAPQRGGRSQPSLRIAVRDPVHTKLHSFFTHRQRLLRALGRRPCRYRRPPAAGRPSGLLALPEDVLVRSICS